MDKLIQLLDSNARLNDAQLAVMLDRTEEEVKAQIASLSGKASSAASGPSSTGRKPTGIP